MAATTKAADLIRIARKAGVVLDPAQAAAIEKASMEDAFGTPLKVFTTEAGKPYAQVSIRDANNGVPASISIHKAFVDKESGETRTFKGARFTKDEIGALLTILTEAADLL